MIENCVWSTMSTVFLLFTPFLGGDCDILFFNAISKTGQMLNNYFIKNKEYVIILCRQIFIYIIQLLQIFKYVYTLK